MLCLWLSNINFFIVQVKLQVQSIDWFKSITWWRVTCSWCLCFWRRRRRRWRWSNKLSFLNLVLHFRGLDDCFKLSILFLLTSRIFSRLYFLYEYIFSLYSGVTSYKYFLCTSQYKQRKSLLLIVYFVLFEQNFINSTMSLWKIVLYGVCFFIFRLYFQDLKEKHRRSWTVWKEWERYIYF